MTKQSSVLERQRLVSEGWPERTVKLYLKKKKTEETRRKQAKAAGMFVTGKYSLEEISRTTGYTPHTILKIAQRLGVKAAGSMKWTRSMQRYVDVAKAKGFDKDSNLADVRALFPKLSEDSVLSIARRLGVKAAGSRMWTRSNERAAVRTVAGAVEALPRGKNISLLSVGRVGRLAAGEEFARGLLKQKSGVEVRQRLLGQGFLAEEVRAILAEIKGKKLSRRQARWG